MSANAGNSKFKPVTLGSSDLSPISHYQFPKLAQEERGRNSLSNDMSISRASFLI